MLKAKTCWSSGIMSNFWGKFFMFWGAKKKFKNFVNNILASALKGCKNVVKIKLCVCFFFLNSIIWFKLELPPQFLFTNHFSGYIWVKTDFWTRHFLKRVNYRDFFLLLQFAFSHIFASDTYHANFVLMSFLFGFLIIPR